MSSTTDAVRDGVGAGFGVFVGPCLQYKGSTDAKGPVRRSRRSYGAASVDDARSAVAGVLRPRQGTLASIIQLEPPELPRAH